MPQDPIHLDPGIQPVMTGGTKGMKKDKGYGLLWMLAAEVADTSSWEQCIYTVDTPPPWFNMI